MCAVAIRAVVSDSPGPRASKLVLCSELSRRQTLSRETAPHKAGMSLLRSLALLVISVSQVPSAAAQCGGFRQVPCVDGSGNEFCTYVPPANQGDRSAPNGAGLCVACGQGGRPPCLDQPVCNERFTLGDNGNGPACVFCGGNCPPTEDPGASPWLCGRRARARGFVQRQVVAGQRQERATLTVTCTAFTVSTHAHMQCRHLVAKDATTALRARTVLACVRSAFQNLACCSPHLTSLRSRAYCLTACVRHLC